MDSKQRTGMETPGDDHTARLMREEVLALVQDESAKAKEQEDDSAEADDEEILGVNIKQLLSEADLEDEQAVQKVIQLAEAGEGTDEEEDEDLQISEQAKTATCVDYAEKTDLEVGFNTCKVNKRLLVQAAQSDRLLTGIDGEVSGKQKPGAGEQ
jgi:hypothetical protein